MAHAFWWLATWLVLIWAVAGQECSASIPCKIGCCSKWGNCGHGPNFCADDVCVNNCDQKAECNPGHWDHKYFRSEKCPLNVCCSEYGFCGTTKEFCGNKTVKRPHCPPHQVGEGLGGFSRVVGYYESWARTRECDVIVPEFIPAGVYTHMNFAFATINPHSFEVQFETRADADMARRLTLLKSADPGLKVFVAIGGWAFSNPSAPTHKTFSELAGASEERQRHFMRSLISFMGRYDFDGVDIDWEYPVAAGRGGKPEDFENFPQFLAKLKSGLRATGGRSGLSITLPASYWYLRHFDVKRLARIADFVNVMTYDMHGTWDEGNQWVGAYLNAHTNLTEIKLAFDLLWRNDVDPQKVTMGMAFYGRSFTVSDPSCTHPGCPYKGGGHRLRCSGSPGVAMNSEIVSIEEKMHHSNHSNHSSHGAREKHHEGGGNGGSSRKISPSRSDPRFDRKAAVKMLTWDTDQWVAYDDGETFQLKADFARSECTGGVFVWAISQDTREGHFSKALSLAAPTLGSLFSSGELPGGGHGGNITYVTRHPQCQWTNCQEDCPGGWIRMMRKDAGARDGEYMVNEEGCGGYGIQQLCCPPDNPLPTCGWYTHNNGDCDHGCPQGATEIGSNDLYCSNNDYQAACCSTDTKSMVLYTTCAWTPQFPNCNAGHCFGGEKALAHSSQGSGGVPCDRFWGGFGNTGGGTYLTERTYCCDTSGNDRRWSQCAWYDSLGHTNGDDGFCRSGCPDSTVRIAMAAYFPTPDGAIDKGASCNQGEKARCCVPRLIERENTWSQKVELEREALRAWMHKPVCHPRPSEGGMGRPESGVSEITMTASGDHFDPWDPFPWMDRVTEEVILEGMLQELLFFEHTLAQVQSWDQFVVANYGRNMSYAHLADFLEQHPLYIRRYGSTRLPRMIICNLDVWKEITSGRLKTIDCRCRHVGCCLTADGSRRGRCLEPPPDIGRRGGGKETGEQERREWRNMGVLPPDGAAYSFASENSSGDAGVVIHQTVPGMIYRDPSHWRVQFQGRTYHGVYVPAPYLGRGYEPSTSMVWNRVFDIDHRGCHYTEIVQRSLAGNPLTSADRENWEEDHFVELQSLSLFTQWAIQSGSVPPEFFTVTMGEELPRDPATNEYPPVAGGEHLPIPRYRVMVALGSVENSRDFMMLMCNLNGMKGKFWVGEFPIADEYMENCLEDAVKSQQGDAGFFFQNLRNARAVISFMNNPQVQFHAMRIIRNVRWEMYQADLSHQRLFPGRTSGALEAWDTWIHQRLHDTVRTANRFIRTWAQRAVDRFHNDQTQVGQDIYAMGNLFLARATTTFNDTNLPRESPPLSPDKY